MPHHPFKIEICVEGIDGLVAAQEGGADRVELCASLLEGGLTPSIGVVRQALQVATIPFHVIIRPRGGDFLYSELEFASMLDDITALSADAETSGAGLRTGGQRIGNQGNFFEPTVFTEVPLTARIMNEEPFGPVALINRFSDDDEALAEANRLPYGLASYAFTRSARTATAIAARVESGMMTINHLGLALPEVPFGGVKDSGYGSEGGTEAIEAYLNTKFVSQAGLFAGALGIEVLED